MKKIKVKNSIVEIDGDEMARVLWREIKRKLLLPYLDIKLIYFDLALENRDRTEDEITSQAAEAIKKYKVAVKCPTITPNEIQVKKYNLKKSYPSPNATIRSLLNGTIFRKPIMIENIPPLIKEYKKPITIARHGYGDMYKNVEIKISVPGKVEMVYRDESGEEIKREIIHEFKSSGIVQGIHNLNSSISSFAKCCFNYAFETKQNLWFGTKNTISKTYHEQFYKIWQETYEKQYEEKFQQAGINYTFGLIDDIAAKIIKSEGGMIWALPNYEGDIMSDIIAAIFRSLALMTSVLVSPDGGEYEFEATHGTIAQHYYRYLKGENTPTNPIALIFAWTGALKKRGELDETSEVVDFSKRLEKAIVNVIKNGTMTKDLAQSTTTTNPKIVNWIDFLEIVRLEINR